MELARIRVRDNASCEWEREKRGEREAREQEQRRKQWQECWQQRGCLTLCP